MSVVDAGGRPERLPDCDLVIDAGFGTGFRGAFDAPATEAPVLACDIPSGVDGLTGQVGGGVYDAVRTVTFAALKPGLRVVARAGHAGAIDVADIGLDTSSTRTAPARGRRHRSVSCPPRAPSDHKWRSACWVIGGSPGMTGAPAMAAGRGHAGRVPATRG